MGTRSDNVILAWEQQPCLREQFPHCCRPRGSPRDVLFLTVRIRRQIRANSRLTRTTLISKNYKTLDGVLFVVLELFYI